MPRDSNGADRGRELTVEECARLSGTGVSNVYVAIRVGKLAAHLVEVPGRPRLMGRETVMTNKLEYRVWEEDLRAWRNAIGKPLPEELEHPESGRPALVGAHA